jgi:DNA-binding NarL/FixJ family response regulator
MIRKENMHIAICDDHPVVIDGIAMLLQTLDAGIRIERLSCAADLLKSAPSWTDMDLVLLDLGLPDNHDLDTLVRMRELRDDVPVIVVSGASDRRSVLRALDHGAMGFVPKTSSAQDMLAAFQTVLEGGIFLPPDDLSAPDNCGTPEAAMQLTPRQWQILSSVLQGKAVKRIARDMYIAESTVKTHITPILRAMGVTTRTEAIVKARQMGLRIPREVD